MTTREIVCSECGEAVPPGRLSCPACGTLLAAVAGAARPQAPTDPGSVEPAIVDYPGDEPLAMAPNHMERMDPAEPLETWGTIGSYEPPAVAGPPPPSVLTAVSIPAAAASAAALPSPADPSPTASSDDEDPSGGRPWWAIDGLDVGIDRAVALGSGLVAVGLLLPWSRVVIGTPDLTSYFGTWGLAGPGHILVLVAAVAVAVFAGVPNRVPAWLRSGVAGLTLGVFVLGLLWPYVVGPLGASIGSLVDLVGAMVLGFAGFTAIWRSRHAPDRRGV